MNAIIESLNAWGVRFTGFALPMLLQSAILIALLFALDLALRKKVRATIRYAVWMLALVKLALPPSLASPTAAAYWLPPKTVENSYAAPVAIPAMSPVIAPVAAPREIIVNTTYNAADATRASAPWTAASPSLTWQAGFLALWLTVAGMMAFGVAWRFWVVLGIIRRSTGSVATVPAMLESCRRQLGVTRDIQVRCAAIGSPAICGVLRPVILLPPGLVENLDEAEMRSVLLHELAHYKRGDLWVNNAQILLQIIYWYNPLLWLANAGIRRAREQAVDEMVLVEMGGEAQTYPATLLHVAKLGLGRPAAALGLMGILEPGRGLTQRILHIMNRPLPRTARIGARALAAVLLLALVALPMAGRPANAGLRTSEGKELALQSSQVPSPVAPPMASHPKNPDAGTTETVRIEGVAQEYSIDSNGKILIPESLQTLYFTLWQSGCRWMYHASTHSNLDLNLDGGTVSFDGTNLYHFLPANGGTLAATGERFKGFGSMDSEPEWRFAGGNGPLWWAYASSCILPQDGPVPSFLDPWGEQFPCSLKRAAVNETIRRVGPMNATLSIQLGVKQPLAEIQPLATNDTDGIRFITKCQVIMYNFQRPKSGEGTNWTPKMIPYTRWEIVLNKFGIEHAPVSFVPEIPAVTEAGRSVPARIEVTTVDGSASYLANHWLAENELKSNGVRLRIKPKSSFGFGAAANPPTYASRDDNGAGVIRFNDLPLTEAIQQLAKQVGAGLNIQFAPALLNQKAANGTPIPPPLVKETWHRVSSLQAMQALLWNYGWQMEQTPTNLVLIRARDPNAAGPPAKTVNLLAKTPPAGAAAGVMVPPDPGDQVAESLVFHDLPLPDSILQLAILAELNIQIDPRLVQWDSYGHNVIPSPNVNKKMTNISPRQALQTLLDEYGWQMTQIPGNPILRVAVKDPLAPHAPAKPAPSK